MITLPHPPTSKPADPWTFTGAYSGCFDYALAAMDPRHVFLLHDVLMSWPFENALEIGCFHGASSTAFIEAINRGSTSSPQAGAGMTATFCDVSVSDQLLSVLRNCEHPDRVRLTPQPSWAVLDSDLPWDFILVDAAHDLDSVSLELTRLLRRRPLCVMAHDTNATAAGYVKCEGAALLARTFRETLGYQCLEDCERREGERTERGVFLATTDAGLYAAAARAFDKWR